MRNFILEQSNKEITSHAGMSLIGACIEKFTSLTKTIDKILPKRHGTPTSDMVKTFVGLLSQGKNDFESINNVRNDKFFHQALNLQKSIPTEASIRLSFEKQAKELSPIIEQSNVEFLINREVPVTPLYTGHVQLDIDVTPHDNSNSKKELVSRTYKGMDGYAPIACYLGAEGWCLRYELREGKQHSQCKFIPLLEQTFNAVHQVMEKQPISSQAILLRIDSAHDAKENRVWVYNLDTPLLVDYIIKWNPRAQASAINKQKWWDYAKQLGHHAKWDSPRKGKRVVTFSCYVDEEYEGKIYTTRRVMRLTERSIDNKGQALLVPELEIEGWWTSLEYADHQIIALYCDHATSEQFHSEFKTDLDLERLPSGKFASNALILTLGMLTYNMLKWIGLAGLMDEHSPIRHQAKRRRVRTVIQELIYIGAHICQRARRLIIRFGRVTPAYLAFKKVYQLLCHG